MSDPEPRRGAPTRRPKRKTAQAAKRRALAKAAAIGGDVKPTVAPVPAEPAPAGVTSSVAEYDIAAADPPASPSLRDGSTVKPPPTFVVLRKSPRRWRGVVIGAVTAIAIGGLGWWTWQLLARAPAPTSAATSSTSGKAPAKTAQNPATAVAPKPPSQTEAPPAAPAPPASYAVNPPTPAAPADAVPPVATAAPPPAASKATDHPAPPTATPAPGGGPPFPPRIGAITTEPLDAVRRRGAAGDVEAMEELARRYIGGIGVKPDPFEGASWLQRAADRGAPGAMFNLGVMHERGMVLDKDPAKALAWYRKASTAGVPMATHNLALMLRDGAGVPADPARGHELLLEASRQGMSASMYVLGAMYEAGSHGLAKDSVQAVVWYALAMEFQRAHPATQNSDLAQRAEQKMADLQRALSPAELRQAQTQGEREYRAILQAMRAANPPQPPSATEPAPTIDPATDPATAPPPQTAVAPPAAPVARDGEPPAVSKEQLEEIQRLLGALRLYAGRPDGIMGNNTRAAIRQFQRQAQLAETGEPSAALLDALRRRTAAPLPR
ncbi:MAG TPA: SEL1-like repeat protein [Vineibacter sp.]|nr:SEL1-like repeat protein [Vineibacter sp.]